jgi:hypothetical protein
VYVVNLFFSYFRVSESYTLAMQSARPLLAAAPSKANSEAENTPSLSQRVESAEQHSMPKSGKTKQNESRAGLVAKYFAK